MSTYTFYAKSKPESNRSHHESVAYQIDFKNERIRQVGRHVQHYGNLLFHPDLPVCYSAGPRLGRTSRKIILLRAYAISPEDGGLLGPLGPKVTVDLNAPKNSRIRSMRFTRDRRGIVIVRNHDKEMIAYARDTSIIPLHNNGAPIADTATAIPGNIAFRSIPGRVYASLHRVDEYLENINAVCAAHLKENEKAKAGFFFFQKFSDEGSLAFEVNSSLKCLDVLPSDTAGYVSRQFHSYRQINEEEYELTLFVTSTQDGAVDPILALIHISKQSVDTVTCTLLKGDQAIARTEQDEADGNTLYSHVLPPYKINRVMPEEWKVWKEPSKNKFTTDHNDWLQLHRWNEAHQEHVEVDRILSYRPIAKLYDRKALTGWGRGGLGGFIPS